MDLFLYFFHTFTIFTILIIVYYNIVLIVTKFIFPQLFMYFIFTISYTILFYFHTTIISVPKIYSIVVIVVVWVYLTDATHNMITSIKFKTINLNPILNITPIINNS
jgi:hypothetical protein